MKYLSVCSGIEAASVAWEPLGWSPVAFAEIEPFPSAILAHHYPDVPNLGDMTHFEEWPEEVFVEADIIVGGCPCQAFSVAGLRQGLADERGNLTLVFIRLVNHADAIRRQHGKPPVIVVYENVPGLLSSQDGAFGSFLGGLVGEDKPLISAGKRWTDAGGVFGPERSVAWRILNAQHFGLAQRRRRVFVVASSGTVSPPEVLFERQGLRGDTPASRETGQAAPRAAGRGPAGASHWDDLRNPHPTLSQSHNTGGLGGSNQEVFAQRGSGLVPIHLPSLQTVTGLASTLSTENSGKRSSPRGDGSDNQVVAPMAFNHQSGGLKMQIQPSVDLANTLQAHQEQAVMLAFALRGREEGAVSEDFGDGQTVGTLRAASGGSSRDYVAFGGNNTSGPIEVATARNASRSPSDRLDFESETFLVQPAILGVRRITPEEGEVLQGFPRGWTRIAWKGKPAEDCPDGHRQKAIGNSKAVPVVRWIGRRIQEAMATPKINTHT